MRETKDLGTFLLTVINFVNQTLVFPIVITRELKHFQVSNEMYSKTLYLLVYVLTA